MHDQFTPALQADAGGASALLPGADMTKDVDGEHTKRKHKGKDWDCPNWMDQRLRGTSGYYPHALASYYHWSGLRHRPFPPDGFLFGDSGGFTIMTLGVNIDPRDVIKWQIRNCKVGVVLDVPPVNKDGEEIFDEALGKTKANTKIAAVLYKKHLAGDGAFRLWGVVHGWRMEQLERWWAELSEVYPFTEEGEGWAFKPRPNITPATTARVLSFVQKHREIKRIHLLMTTGVDSIATLLCLGPQSGLDFVSYDSSTPTLMATNRTLIDANGDGLGWEPSRELGEETHIRRRMLTTCECFSCQQLRIDTTRYSDLPKPTDKWQGYWVFRFAYHNLLTMVNVFANLRRTFQTYGSDTSLSKILGPEEASKALRAFEGREQFADEAKKGKPRTLLDMI